MNGRIRASGVETGLVATGDELLAVTCPTCGAQPERYCEERPGKVLLLPYHHEARFRAAIDRRERAGKPS